jgi:hypothetical protein
MTVGFRQPVYAVRIVILFLVPSTATSRVAGVDRQGGPSAGGLHQQRVLHNTGSAALPVEGWWLTSRQRRWGAASTTHPACPYASASMGILPRRPRLPDDCRDRLLRVACLGFCRRLGRRAQLILRVAVKNPGVLEQSRVLVGLCDAAVHHDTQSRKLNDRRRVACTRPPVGNQAAG